MEVSKDEQGLILDVLKETAEGNKDVQLLRAIENGAIPEELAVNAEHSDLKTVRHCTDVDPTLVQQTEGELPVPAAPVEEAGNPEDLKKLIDGSPTEQREAMTKMMTGDMTPEDALGIYNLAQRYKLDKTINLVAEMPEYFAKLFKEQVAMAGLHGAKAINMVAHMFMNDVVKSIETDSDMCGKMFKEEIDQVMEIPSTVDIFSDQIRIEMEEKLPKRADLIEESSPVRAEELRDVSHAYTDAYTLERQFELLKSDGVITKLAKLTKEKHYKRLVDDLDWKASKAKYKFHKVENIKTALTSLFNTGEQAAREYIALLYLIEKNYRFDNEPEVWFMYASIENVLIASMTNKTKTEFSTLIIDNIKKLLGEIEKRKDEVYSV